MKGEMNPSRRESGQSIVELSVTFVFLMLLLAGVADIGRAFFTYIALRDAAQEGAAYGTIFRFDYDDAIDCGAIVNRTESTSTTPVDLQSSDIGVNIQFIGDSGTRSCAVAASQKAYQDTCFGNEIMVQVSYDNFPLVTPFLGTFVGRQTVPISASVRDSILTPPCE